MLSNSGAGDSSWESLGQQEDQTNTKKKSTLNIHWMNWCWSWSSKTLATWCKEQTDWKRLWYWEILRTRGEGGDRGWDGWLVSTTQWTWVEQTPGDTERQGSLVCWSSWSHTRLSDWTTTTNCWYPIIWRKKKFLSILPLFSVFLNNKSVFRPFFFPISIF